MANAPAPAAPRTLDALIEGVLAGAVTPVSTPSEAEFHLVWVEREVSLLEPLVMAAYGGASADRLAWVFQSGYQATLRNCFPQIPAEPGWMAFANTEGVGGLEGTTLSGEPGNRRLNGWKTWLAGAGHVNRLLVSAKHNQLPFLVVRRETPGVLVENSREGGTYLPELIQGRVGFTDVPITEDEITGDERTFPTFRASEGAYVRVALTAFILAHAVRLDAPTSVISGAVAGLLAAAGGVSLPRPSAPAALALAGVDQQVRNLAREFEVHIGTADPALHERWLRDQRLFRGSEATAQRAEAALANLRGTSSTVRSANGAGSGNGAVPA